MFVKIATIALMAFIASSKGEKVWDGLTSKWASNPVEGFYTLPQNYETAKSEGWTRISGVTTSGYVKALGYHGDPRVVLLFSRNSNQISGIQVGFPVADIENAGVPIDYANHSGITKKTLNGEDYFTGTVYFHQNERGEMRKLWLEDNHGLVEIPTNAELVTSRTSYFLKRCVTWMGQHYYRVNSTTDCSEIFPWDLLRVGDNIVGVIFQVLGNASSASERTWFEAIPLAQIAYTVSDAPTCVGEYVAAYGFTSLHIWFKKNPVAINCTDECTAVINSTMGEEKSHKGSGKRYKRAIGSGNICPV